MRNFHIAADIDGRKTQLTGGPARKDGGFKLIVMMRQHGESVVGLTLIGKADPDGTLTLVAIPGSALERVTHGPTGIFQVETER